MRGAMEASRWGCLGMTGCSCVGPACSFGYPSEAECMAAYEGCRDVVTTCGGLAGGRCQDDEYCAYVPGLGCGILDASAVCMPRPDACDGNYEPVCGCDNETHGNACEAASAGTGIFAFGACEASSSP